MKVRPFKLASAAELGFTLAHLVAPATTWLPIGGSQVAQVALCFGIAGLLHELLDL